MSVVAEFVVDSPIRLTVSRDVAMTLVSLGGHVCGDGEAKDHIRDVEQALVNLLHLGEDEVEETWVRWGESTELRTR